MTKPQGNNACRFAARPPLVTLSPYHLITLSVSLCLCGVAFGGVPEAGKYFAIKVVDEQTGRGVPLVELKTTHGVRYYTDSAGLVAFYEPGLMGQEVFFHVKSHGYEYPKDGFGYAGVRLQVIEGGHAEIKIKRLNIAERLYRVTGGGIYRDSVLLGQPVPIEQPVLNGLVFGSDSVLNAVYQGKLFWIWGDTNWPRYPLGNFNATGATSRLPGDGGLDPPVGVNLTYLVGENGFAKGMAPVPGEGPTWLDALVTLPDASGRERLLAAYAKIRPGTSMECYERGFVEYNDEKQLFERIGQFDVNAPVFPAGHPLRVKVGEQAYFYFARALPLVRVQAKRASYLDITQCESYTCLKEGTRAEEPQIDRDEQGKVRYAWRRDTPPLGCKEQNDVIKAGHLKPDEALVQAQDVDTGKAIVVHGGSVYWNEYRGRWIMIALEAWGASMLGEVWYFEADTPVGPWVYGRKIVTHDTYSFYNPKQHPEFDQDGGRVIFFEGTYAETFSGNPTPTPRYDYNQIMYRLDLADARLVLPVAVYDLSDDTASCRFATGRELRADGKPRLVAFFACDRSGAGLIPVWAENASGGGVRLFVQGAASAPSALPAATFYALPPDGDPNRPTVVGLYEVTSADGKQRSYTTATREAARPGFTRAEQPVCYVWRNPLSPAMQFALHEAAAK